MHHNYNEGINSGNRAELFKEDPPLFMGLLPHHQRKEGEVFPWDNQKLVNEGWPDGKPLPDYGQ